MPGAPQNLGSDPFMVGQSSSMGPPPYGSAAAAAQGRNVNLAGDPFMDNAQRAGRIGPASQQMHGQGKGPAGKEDLALEVTIRMAEGLPPQPKGSNKAFPVCVVQVRDKPRARLTTGPCKNGSVKAPVWGTAPEYFRSNLPGWQPGDTLTFTIQDEDATSSRIICMKDLMYNEYQNGYEWWLKMDVAKMKQYPEGWPYAGLQIKVHPVQAVKLTPQDPWMSDLQGEAKRPGFCKNYCFDYCCNHCCLPCRMWCCRRSSVCCLWLWVYTRWSCVMCCVGCTFACLTGCKLCTMTWSWCIGKQSLNDLRRDCAKRFKLSDDDGDAEGDTACCCIPLRTAVFLISVLTTINAFIAFFFPTLFNRDGQSPMGYTVVSRVIIGATQITGSFFGPVGALGAFDLNVSLLKTYNYYQFIRISAMFFMIYTDIPLLYDCNIWRTDLKAAIAEHGWNPAMYSIAMGNSCLQAQIDFVVAAVLQLCVYTYLVSLTRRLISDIETTPRYLLAMPKDCPNGAFTSTGRTQGKARPPYGSILGNEGPQNPLGYLENYDPRWGLGPQNLEQNFVGQGLVGPAVQVPGGFPSTLPSGFRY